MSCKVFISHSSKDKPAVREFARELRDRGIDAWVDEWEIGPGDDIVECINAGLEKANAGIIVFSKNSEDSRWIKAETSYLIYSRIVEEKVLIPVVLGADAWIPPLVRPLARRSIDEIDAIVDALQNRGVARPPLGMPKHGRVERVGISLKRNEQKEIEVDLKIGGQQYNHKTIAGIPRALIEAQMTFLKGFRKNIRRGPEEYEHSFHESNIAQLGCELREFLIPDDSGKTLVNLVDGCHVGTTIEVCFEADDPVLMGLPFEAIRLPDDRLLATQKQVVMYRSPAGSRTDDTPRLAGPVKVLVAVGAPDEDKTDNVVLDLEHELKVILDAVAEAQRNENFEVRILEVGHPDVIAAAMEHDAYHVLHLSCHGMPGKLELEDEDGCAVRVSAKELLDPIRQTGKPLPLVFLNSCHGGVIDPDQMVSFAEELLHAGVPAVLAMQTSVSDIYATRLASAFYTHLSRRETFLPSRALADARKELESARLKAIQSGALPEETRPEYATASLFVAGEEQPIADFSLDNKSLKSRPVYNVDGPVPQLGIDDLIGRRKELRLALRTLRDENRHHAGVVLTGIGGVGKSAIAGRAMCRLKENGWLVPAHKGPFDVGRIAVSIGCELMQLQGAESKKLGALLGQPDLEDAVRLNLIAKSLAEEQIVLVLDDFEQNLVTGGGAYKDTSVETYLGLLIQNTRTGRLLITSRHSVPRMDMYLQHISIGPLSRAESRKLFQRLPSLKHLEYADYVMILRVIGGHPRMLEFLDALLSGGVGRLNHVTEKLKEIQAASGIDSSAVTDDLEAGIRETLLLGARDVFLGELLDIARKGGIDEVLIQASVSNLPVTPDGLTRMIHGDVSRLPEVAQALKRLDELSLVYRFHDGSVWVHRWTAEGLADQVDETKLRKRYNLAGQYRMWQAEHESHNLIDVIEAVRNHLAGRDYNNAARETMVCCNAFKQLHQSMGIASLASEVLDSLPKEHRAYNQIADEEAQALLSLGFINKALERYHELLIKSKRKVDAEPENMVYQRDLSVSYNNMGDLYRALGRGEEAREYYQKSLEIAERLASGEPNRADYQRDLVISLIRVGSTGEKLDRKLLQRALDILLRLKEQGKQVQNIGEMISDIKEMLGK